MNNIETKPWPKMSNTCKFIMVLIGLIAIVLFSTSCNTKHSGNTVIATHDGMPNDSTMIYGSAKVLENGTSTYVIFKEKGYAAYEVYKTGDTVWLNMSTHHIDDIDSNAMMVVLVK